MSDPAAQVVADGPSAGLYRAVTGAPPWLTGPDAHAALAGVLALAALRSVSRRRWTAVRRPASGSYGGVLMVAVGGLVAGLGGGWPAPGAARPRPVRTPGAHRRADSGLAVRRAPAGSAGGSPGAAYRARAPVGDAGSDRQ
ncbi:MAG TPA: hypothetical protein VF755_09580 [Catenuloplanes sp.]|jgi:hypothetical protein